MQVEITLVKNSDKDWLNVLKVLHFNKDWIFTPEGAFSRETGRSISNEDVEILELTFVNETLDRVFPEERVEGDNADLHIS